MARGGGGGGQPRSRCPGHGGSRQPASTRGERGSTAELSAPQQRALLQLTRTLTRVQQALT